MLLHLANDCDRLMNETTTQRVLAIFFFFFFFFFFLSLVCQHPPSECLLSKRRQVVIFQRSEAVENAEAEVRESLTIHLLNTKTASEGVAPSDD